jgi:hypothetical protein
VSGSIRGGTCGAACTPNQSQCSTSNQVQLCDSQGFWGQGSFQPPQCTAECVPPDSDCQGVVPRTCGPSGRWASQSIERGKCGADCGAGQEACGNSGLSAAQVTIIEGAYSWSASSGTAFSARCNSQGLFEREQYCSGMCTAGSRTSAGYACVISGGNAACIPAGGSCP